MDGRKVKIVDGRESNQFFATCKQPKNQQTDVDKENVRPSGFYI